MNKTERTLGILCAAAFMAAAVFSVQAQDPGGSAPAPAPADQGAAPAGGDASAAPAEGGGEAAEAPAAPVKPRPAEIMPLTPKGLLLDVAHTSNQYIAVGDRGGIIVSADAKEWKQVPVPVRAALTAVTFVDDNHGWAVGHDAAIVATEDGGKTWKLQNFKPELEKPLLDVLFLDATHGFAVGAYGLFLQTADAGATWTEVDAKDVRGDEVHLNSITKLGNGALFIAGESGMLAISSDQGKTWTKLKSPYDSSLFGALPVGDKGAMIYGLRGNVFVCNDLTAKKGPEWTKVETHSVASMFGGTVLPDGKLAMVGLNGVILVADASGAVHAVQTPTGTPLSSAIPMNGGLLAVGESGIQPIASLQ